MFTTLLRFFTRLSPKNALGGGRVLPIGERSPKRLRALVSMGNDKKEITECSFLHHSSSLHQRAGLLVVNSRGRGNMPQQFLNHLKRARPISFLIHTPLNGPSSGSLPVMGRNWRRYVAKCCAEQVVGLCDVGTERDLRAR